MNTHLTKLAADIDWELLNQQKGWLLDHCTNPHAQGLIQLLDCLQDIAVLDGLADAETVFGPMAD